MALPTHPLGISGLHITRVGFDAGPAKLGESRALQREVA
jgi:hypothetical protein